MRITALFTMLVIAIAVSGCGSSSSCKTGCMDGGRAGGGGTPSAGGRAGGGGGIGVATAETGGRAGGGGGTTAGTAGAAGAAGAAGTAGASCGEPASCEGYDNSADATLAAMVTCLSPSSTKANVGFALAIFGHHLVASAGTNAIVTIGNSAPLNGVPASACHIDVAVPASAVASPGQLHVVVSPGGRIQDSAPLTLTVH